MAGTRMRDATDVNRSSRAGGNTLYARLTDWAERTPGIPAILAPGRAPLSFAALAAQLDEIRHALNAQGLGRGDRIAVVALRGPESAASLLGVACSASCVPIPASATPAECRTIVARSGVKAVIAPRADESPMRGIADELDLIEFQTLIPRGAPAGRIRLESERPGVPGQCNAPNADDEALVLCTSGTTSRPKLVPSSHRQLLARMHKLCRLLGLSAADRCLNLMPLCYANGLYSGTIGPLTSGGSVVYPTEFRRNSVFQCLRELAPTWYTGAASYQQAIAEWLRDDPDAVRGHHLRFVRSGSSPLPGWVQEALESAFNVAVSEGYASSETGIITANPPDERRVRGTVGLSGDDHVAVLDEDGRPLPRGCAGEVAVCGPTVFDGYIGDAETNRRRLHGGWFRTGDLGVLDAEGYLTLTGRIEDIINRGGEKISPAEVDAALLAHPEVREAAAFAIPHPALGEDLAAAVRLWGRTAVSDRDLRRFLLQRLSTFKVPHTIVFVRKLPKGPTGKPLRRKLPELLTRQTGAASGRQEGAPLEKILLGLWRRALGRDDVDLDGDFFLLGGSSLSAVDLLAGIEEALRLRLPLASLIEMPTVREFARCLQKHECLDRHATTTGDLLGVNTGGRQPPLFALCGRYGHAFRLLPVARELGDEQPVYALQPPNMDWQGAGCRSIEQMAAYYIERIRAIQPHGPYRLFGTSFGGLVMFEIALQFQSLDEDIELLALLDTAPTIVALDGNTDAPDAQTLEVTQRRLAEAEQRETDRTRAAGIRTASAHVAARANYVMNRRVRGELVYLYCTSHLVQPDQDRRRLWRTAATDGLRLLPLPGRHGLFHREPQFSALCHALRACLAGRLPTGDDPTGVFERRYALHRGTGGETITQEGGDYRVTPGSRYGCLARLQPTGHDIALAGWARDPDGRPARALAVFRGSHYLGHAACGVERPKARRGTTDRDSEYTGFRLRIPLPPNGSREPLRLFMLCDSGHAYELANRVTKPPLLATLLAPLSRRTLARGLKRVLARDHAA